MQSGLNGNLAAWPLTEMLSMLVAAKQTGSVVIADPARPGEIYLRDGALVHATCGNSDGEPALAALACRTEGAFAFTPKVEAPAMTIDRSSEEVLANCQRIAAEARSLLEAIPTLEVAIMPVLRAPAQPVSLQPSEWTVIARLRACLTAQEVAAQAGLDEFSIRRTLLRLTGAGLVELKAPAELRAAAPAPAPVAQPAAPAPQPVAQQQPAPAREPAAPQPPREAPPPAMAEDAAPRGGRGGAVPPSFIQALEAAAKEALGPVAPLVIEDELRELGAHRNALTAEQASTLTEHLANEIRDQRLRSNFQRAMLEQLRGIVKAA